MPLSPTDPGLGAKPAPGELAYVQAFVNTHNVESDAEALHTPEALRDWLIHAELLSPRAPRLTPADLSRALALREALRHLLLANAGGPIDPEAAVVVEREARAAPATLRVGADGLPRLQAAGQGLDQAVSRLLAAVATAAVDGTWRRLKICRADDCLWAFYDASRNASGAWCVMSDCGNRAKARRFRASHPAHALTAPATSPSSN